MNKTNLVIKNGTYIKSLVSKKRGTKIKKNSYGKVIEHLGGDKYLIGTVSEKLKWRTIELIDTGKTLFMFEHEFSIAAFPKPSEDLIKSKFLPDLFIPWKK